MRRLLRHLFTVCSAVSLALCIAMCVHWVRSYWVADILSHRGQTSRIAHSNCGEVTLTAANLTGTVPYRGNPHPFYVKTEASARARAGTQTDPGVTTDFDFGGFTWLVTNGGMVASAGRIQQFLPRWLVRTPHWFLALLFASIPAVRRLSRWQPKPGMCPTCGYDLRARPDRCPECGNAVALA